MFEWVIVTVWCQIAYLVFDNMIYWETDKLNKYWQVNLYNPF